MAEIVLTGLDGSNPLAFLASLGVLNAVSDQSEAATLEWKHQDAWRPVLRSSVKTIDGLCALLDDDRMSFSDEAALALSYDGKQDLKAPPGGFHDFLNAVATDATARKRRSVDLASAFATDVAVDNNGNTKPTALHFTAGQQQFLQMAGELARRVVHEDVAEAVLGPWQYVRPLPVMGWDATSSRDYALRASDPSTDKKLGVPGADWLAIRGLDFLPTVPRGNRVLTTSCTGGWKDGSFRWALWNVPLTRPIVRSLLQQDVVAIANNERTARGIACVLSSGIKRSDQGGYGSFEPASIV